MICEIHNLPRERKTYSIYYSIYMHFISFAHFNPVFAC